MSENGVMDRPRRSTRNSLASASGTPGTPSSSSNPYKKPTYLSNSRGGSETPTSSKNTNGTPSTGRGRRGRGRPPGRASSSRGGGSHSYQHTKPECIAVRVDGRRSTGGSTASSGGGRRGATSGGRRSTYSSRHEYEYHYGSDFDSDQNDSDPDEDDLESEQEEESEADSLSLAGDNDNESDSDYSISSTRAPPSRLPSPPVPIWLDTEKVPDIPPLELPNSSDDLLLSREHVVKAVEIYEPLRRFHQLVRLSPFRFEDFCAALACEDQSSLLAEMHIQLLKCVIREEDANGTLFGPNEVKDSVQAVVYFVDHITWPETIRSYLESDPAWKDVYEAMISVEYPFCGPAVRIKVLGWLVDQFLATNAVREQLLGDGTILHEDHCRACNRLGELICCESCPAVYHIECLNPPLKDPENPPDMWKCPVCMKHQIPGVTDCTSEVEKMGLLMRHERLGYDRHGRKYWFLVRRILIESEDGSEIWYYTTRGQVEDLLSRLDADNYESALISNIKSMEDEIYRQIEITEEVTRQQNTQRRKTYLDVENGKDMDVDGPERVTRLKSTGLYKLGQENLFKQYVNHFISDPLATSKGKHNEERDRKRHMSHKFSLTTASECKYGIKDLTGCTRQTQISALRGALTHMEAALPTTLMHVNWPMLRKAWLTNVQTGTSSLDFSRAMLMISTCIRSAVYNPVWSESTGHVRFSRMTLIEREERKKSEKRDKKDKDDEEDRLKAEAQFTKNPLPIRHQVYKQKGEEYRVHGRWGWIWLSNMRRCKSQDCRELGLLAGPHKHVIQVKNETGKVKTMLIDPGVYSKLMAKRNLAVTSSASGTPATSSATTNGAVKSDNSKNADDASSAPAQDSLSSSDQKPEDEKNESDISPEESSVNSNSKESEEGDVDMKDSVSVEEDQTKKSPATEEVVKLEDNENVERSGSDEVTPEENSKKTNKENEKGETIEPKVEPMDVDGHESIQHKDNEVEVERKQEETMVNGELSEEMEEEKGNEHQQKENEVSQSEKMDEDKEKNSEEEPTQSNENDAVKSESTETKNEAMEVDEGVSQKAVESINSGIVTSTVSPNNINGSTSSLNTSDEKAVDSSLSESKSTSHAEESQNGAANSSSVPTVSSDSKTDDSQGRKFKTELVNVSSGLASAHRILYPKVARRSEYLDSLLHRRLTLMSLEEKQLKSTYGEEMVARAKTGLIQFEEEEKKREQEAEEYPGEEVVDENLTLGGAYAFCCYSSECRKEAREFMKTKGKNRERLYEKICYSPMCRLKFCLQETTRFKQERMREIEKEKYYKVYKEIEEKRQYTVEGTSHKVYMKKLPDCLTVTPSTPASGGIGGGSSSSALHNKKNKPKTPPVKYPQLSTFRYASSKKPSILVLPPFELKRLARTAGRQFTPAGFFPNQKSGSWGWSLPCGRPVFRTAWQYKTTHAKTLATAAMQLRILYASIRWDDILAKIPNNDGRHQVQTDTEIITTEILNHRIVGRFMERVQYLRRMQVVPIDAPKTIREITPSRIGLRKRKRAESPDKTEPVVTEDWVDEEKLELWEIRFYGDRIDRKHTGIIGRFSDSSSPSTRTKSGIAIKQPEKFDPSHNPNPSGERRTYAAAHNQITNPTQQHNVSGGTVSSQNSSSSSSCSSSSSMADTVDSTIEQVIRNHDPSRIENKVGEGGKTVSAVKTAELMRETIETEMKMQRAVHLSKRDSHIKHNPNGSPHNGTKQGISTPVQATASQQFQMQQNSAKSISASAPTGGIAGKTTAAVPVGTPTSSKVGGVVVGRKFFSNRQSTGATATSDGAILTKRPLQNTITINKGASGTISVVKNNPAPTPAPVQQQPQNPPTPQQIPQQQAVTQVPTTVAVATLAQPIIPGQTQTPTAPGPSTNIQPQKLSVIRLPDGRLQVRGLLPGQHCYQTPDGKIHVTVATGQTTIGTAKQVSTTNTPSTTMATSVTAAQPPPVIPPQTTSEPQQTPQQQAVTNNVVPISTSAAVVTTSTMPTPIISSTSTLADVNNAPVTAPLTEHVTAVSQQVVASQPVVTSSTTGIVQVQQTAQAAVSSQQQPVINISNQAVKSNISNTTGLVATTGANNKPAVTIQQPQHQIIVQQPNGQQLIIQGAAAQAIIQKQQLAAQAQQRAAAQLVQTSMASQQQLIKHVSTPTGQVAVKSPVVVQTSSGAAVGGIVSSSASTVQGRIVIQDGKAVLIGNTAGITPTAQQQQKNVIMSSKQVIQASSAPQQTIVRPQMIQTSAGGQIIQGGAVQLIQSGQGLHFITQQASPQQTATQQVIASVAATSGAMQAVVNSSSGTVTAGSGVIGSTMSLPMVPSPSGGIVSSPAKTSVVVSATPGTPTMTTAVKHVLADGRTILLSPNQFTDIGGRKVILNKQVAQLPTSTPTGLRPSVQQQLLQSLVGSNSGTIQIIQGPNGQQFLIQQPAASAQQSAAATMIQQAQQQQVQFVVPGGQLGGQPLLVKKFVKTSGPVAAGGSPSIVNKTAGNVVQIGSTAQNQLTQLLGPNKALVRLDNNQLAAIHLPTSQTQAVQQTSTVGTAETVSSLASPTVTKTPVSVQTPTQPAVPSSPVLPTTPQPPQQQQTTITRTPGLPISIVSPSKSKVQQQQQTPKTQGTSQAVSSSPAQPSSGLSSATTPTASTITKSTTPTIIRMPSNVVKGTTGQQATSSANVTSQQQKPSTPITPQSLRVPVTPSTPNTSSLTSPAAVSTPIVATKSAPPPVQVTSSPPGPVIISSQTQQQQISNESSPPTQSLQQVKSSVTQSTSPSISPSVTNPAPIITATKSQPPPLPPQSESTPIAVKSVPPPVPSSTPASLTESTLQQQKPTTVMTSPQNTTSGPIAVKSTPPQMSVASPTPTVPTVPNSPTNSVLSAAGSPAASLSSTPKTKSAPSKIVAQIFQTPQGPKVVIQGVNPGELTQTQMMQLQAQIQKQLAAQALQQAQQQKPVVSPSTTKGKVSGSTPAVMPPASTAVVQQSAVTPHQNSVTAPSQQTTSTLPTILQSKQQSGNSLSASALTAQHQSPVEVLRSAASSTVSHTSPLTSPVLPRSPPPTTMVSPAKVLSPPANLPNLLSPAKSVVGRQDMVAALSSVKEPSVSGNATILTSPGQPVVVARKSQPRKSPIRPNNLDSPPPPPVMSPPPPPPPRVVHNNVNNDAMELMRPLTSEQQNILADHRNALKEDIMEKKKQAATQMRLDAQREIQEKLEKQKAVELANSKMEEQKRVVVQQHNTMNDSSHARGAKKRKMDTNESSNSRSSSGSVSPATSSTNSSRGPRGRGKRGKRKLLCICKTPYDKDKFYVGCDKCENWFHGDCIGITEEMSKDLPEYICDDCRDDKLYCMCKKPYNESQFYIQCDKCEDWFHGRCVGVLQGESDTIGDYSCPSCEPNSEINLPNGKKLDNGDYVTIGRLLKELLSNRSSHPFRKPVSRTQAPNYFSIIKEPMDLQTISNRVENKQYECLREFIGDVGKIFENCRYYNDSSTDIFRHADNLEKFFVQKVWALRQALNTRLQQVIP